MMPEDYFQKNIELWEKFTSSYMDTMFSMVEKSMNQSQAFRDQMDRVVNQAVSQQLETTVSTLKAMQKQMDNISEKMDELLKKADSQ